MRAIEVLSVLLLLAVMGCGGNGTSSGGRIAGEEERLPGLDDFVAVEHMPEMIHYENPQYPRLALAAGLEGSVLIRALVVTDGSVRDAVVHKSSGTPALDEAALRAAYKCRFKPALQNGGPVAMWTKYKVNFSLDENQ